MSDIDLSNNFYGDEAMSFIYIRWGKLFSNKTFFLQWKRLQV